MPSRLACCGFCFFDVFPNFWFWFDSRLSCKINFRSDRCLIENRSVLSHHVFRCPSITFPRMPQERLVGKGFLVDRWMLRAAGWRSLQRRGCRRHEVRLRLLHGDQELTARVHMTVRRPQLLGEHTCLYTFVSCSFNVGRCHVFFFFQFQTDILEHFGLKLKP